MYRILYTLYTFIYIIIYFNTYIHLDFLWNIEKRYGLSSHGEDSFANMFSVTSLEAFHQYLQN